MSQNNDLISRQMAIEAICKACSMVEDYHKCDYYPETSVLLCDELVALRALPSVQPDHVDDISKKVDGDCISRRAAIDALDIAIERYDEIAEKYRKKADIERNDYMDMRDNAYEAQQLAQWLNELKYLREKIEQITIKTEPKWIPCCERLPNHDEYIKNNGLFIVSDGNRSYSEWYDIYDKRRFGEPTMSGFRIDYAVTAWMPIPIPYCGGNEE